MTIDDRIRALEGERITFTPDHGRTLTPDRTASIDTLLGQCIATLAHLMAEDTRQERTA